MKLLHIYYYFDNVALVAPRHGYQVTSVHLSNLNVDCNSYFDVVWFNIPYGFENDDDILNALNLIEYINFKNYVVTIFKNNILENKWYFYGMNYNDVDSINYGSTYNKHIRIYSNIFTWNNNVINRYHPMLKSKKRKFNDVVKIPAILIREILYSIL